MITVVLLLSCNGDNVPDCFQNAGPIVQKEFSLDAFDKITVFERLELIVKDDDSQKVIIETGEFLLNDVDVNVENGRLIVRNNNSCNLTRDYGITKVFVSAPNITEIRNSSGLTVRSDGVLGYNDLTLLSEDFNASEDFYNNGDFNLNVDSDAISIITNDISNVFLSGLVTDLSIGFFSGDGRFDGTNLVVQNVNVFHRGTNDIIINPQVSLTGEIRSTGDVISLNQPPTVTIETFYTGRLIFQN